MLTKAKYRDALPDFFVMLHENNNNDLNIVVNFCNNHILNKQSLSKYNIDYSTCTSEELNEEKNNTMKKIILCACLLNYLSKIAQKNEIV